MRDVPTSPHVRSAPILRQYPPALLATPFSPPRRSTKKPIAVDGQPDDFVSKEDEGLFAFINTLRLSVKATVAAEQERGLSLAEIVVLVREMVRVAEQDAQRPKRFPSRAFRAISRQAVAWCVESYRPLLFTAAQDFSHTPNTGDPLDLKSALDRAGAAGDRPPALSPNNRGLP